MALALAILHTKTYVREKEYIVQATPSGNYANSGTTGDTVNLTTATNPNFESAAFFGFPGKIDDYEVLQSPPGYLGSLVAGSGLTNWGLRVFESNNAVGALAELTNGAYPAGVLASVFLLRFRGPKLRI